MPGNEAPEHIHNFFDQDNSSQGHQSQARGGNWAYLNNNPLVGTQTHSGINPHFPVKNYGSQSLDSQRGDDIQSIWSPFGTNAHQINPDGQIHGSQVLQGLSQGNVAISDGHHNLTNRSFSSFEPHQNGPMYRSGTANNLECQDSAGTPVGYDFLGGQQIVKSQHPELDLSHSRAQQGVNQMQLWQQQLMLKRLQEMQRQQQLQQLQESGRHHNLSSQLSGTAGQETNAQLSGPRSGPIINDTSNFTRSNESMGGQMKLLNNPNMMHSANMTWAQQRSGSSAGGIPNALMHSYDQSHLRSMRSVPQQADQSLYGTPVSSARGPQFQGTGHGFTSANMAFKNGVNQADKALVHPSSLNYAQGDQYADLHQGYLHNGASFNEQGIQGENLFGNTPVQSESGGATSGSFQQPNHFSASAQVQEVEQVGPSQGVTSLDPIEEKLLFGADERNLSNLFGGLNGRGTGESLHKNTSQSSEYSAFPSIQSGSWSALMQDAVEASSSDTGLNEKWSGLSFPKTDLSSVNHSAVAYADNGKQHAPWGDGNYEKASSLNSRHLPLFHDADGSRNCHATPVLQPSNFSNNYGEGVQSNSFHSSFQQSSKEPSGMSSHLQNQYVQSSMPKQPHSNSVSNGFRTGSMLGKPVNSSHTAEFNLQNMQQHWVQQQVGLQGTNEHPMNKSSTKKSDYEKHVTDTFLKHKTEKYQNHPNSSPRAWGSSIDNTDKMSGETLYKQEMSHPKEPPNQGLNSSFRMSSQTAERGGLPGNNSYLARNGPHASVNSNLMSGQNSRENTGTRRFPFYQMENMEMNMEPTYSRNKPSNSHGAQPGVTGIKSSEQDYVGCKQFAGHAANSVVDMRKGHSTDSKINARAEEEMQSRSSFHNQFSVPFPNGATSQFLQKKQSGLMSENMLELLHKVDRSREGNAVESFGSSVRNASSEMADADVSDGSASQGISLNLAPPAQRSSLSERSLASQISLQQTAKDSFERNSDSALRENVHTWPLSPTSVQSLPPSKGTSLGENLDEKSLPENRSKESMNANFQGNSLAGAAYAFPVNQHRMHQQQQIERIHQQQNSSASRSSVNNHSTDISIKTVGAASQQPFHSGKRQGYHIGAADQSVEALVPGDAGGMAHNIFAHSAANTASVASHFNPVTAGHSQFTISSSRLKSSDQQNVSMDMRTSAQSAGVLPQSMSPLRSGRESDSQTPQRAGNHGKRKGEISISNPGVDVNGTSSQDMLPPGIVGMESKTVNATIGRYADLKHQPDRTSVISRSSLGQLHEQDHNRGKHSQDTSSVSQRPNYSLLQQIQASKDTDTGPSERAMKRLKGADLVSQSFGNGQNTILRGPGATSQNISNPSGVRISTLSSREIEGKVANTSLQDNAKEAPSQDKAFSKDHDIKNHMFPHGKTLPNTFVGGSVRPQISPQMAPSWFEQYGNSNNGHASVANNTVECLQRNAKAVSNSNFFSKFSEGVNQTIVPEQRHEAGQVSNPQKDLSPLERDNQLATLASPSFPSIEVTGIPKKQISAAEDVLPREKEMTETRQRLQSIISATQQEWVKATNRLVDKVEDETVDDGSSVPRSRRRLILTSQLMQQLFHSVPSTILAADVTASYEAIAYFCAKLTLRDACCLISRSESDPHMNIGDGNMGSGKLKISEKEGDNHFGKTVEDFIGGSRKLEVHLSRDKTASILDLRLECQELERTSILHRFAKFHAMAKTEEAGSSSTAGIVPRRTYPQRHVTALALRTSLPEEVACFSL